MRLGNAIRLCRTQLGKTQAELAKNAGISVSYLSLVEQDKRDPALSVITKLSNSLGIPVNLLIFLAAENTETAKLPEELIDKLSSLIFKLLKERSDDESSSLFI